MSSFFILLNKVCNKIFRIILVVGIFLCLLSDLNELLSHLIETIITNE